jgi:hypothetical protein
LAWLEIAQQGLKDSKVGIMVFPAGGTPVALDGFSYLTKKLLDESSVKYHSKKDAGVFTESKAAAGPGVEP